MPRPATRKAPSSVALDLEAALGGRPVDAVLGLELGLGPTAPAGAGAAAGRDRGEDRRAQLVEAVAGRRGDRR